MKPVAQAELERLIELLLEERITPADVIELNLLLKDPTAQEYYVDYVMLHGMLGWDAGLNCPFSHQVAESIPAIKCAATYSPEDKASHSPQADIASTITPGSAKSSGFYKRWSSLVIAASVIIMLGLVGYYRGLDLLSPAPAIVKQQVIPAEDATVRLAPENQQPGAPPKFPHIQLANQDSIKAPQPHDVEIKPQPTTESTASKAGQNYATDDFSDASMINIINQELAKTWQETGVTPSPMAEDSEWLRRVYLDLAGRIPTATELSSFQNNRHPHKRAELVQTLLQSQDFSRQFANRWSTLLVGRSREKHAERAALRDFLVTSIRQEHTWSRIFQDLITAEGSLQENGASGFLLAHLNDMAVPATAVTCRLLLGEQLQCVQCHKHPHNDWTQDYFWEINSFFKQTKAVTFNDNNQKIIKLISEDQGGPTYYETANGLMKVAYPKLGEVKVDPGQQVNRRQEFSRLLLTQKDQQVSRAFVNRSWAMLFGFGFTNPIDDLGPHNPASHPQLLDQLARGFVANNYDIRKLMSWICLSDAYQLTTKLGNDNSLDQPEKGETPLFSRVYLKMMSPEQLYVSLLMLETHQARMLPELSDQEAWTEQFVIFAQNDENDEFDQFSGTVNQALELMNGDLMDEVIHKSCQQLLSSIKHKGKWTDAQSLQLVRLLSRAYMSRDPSPREIVVFKQLLEQNLARATSSREQALLQTMEDMAWAFLNSSEFVLIH